MIAKLKAKAKAKAKRLLLNTAQETCVKRRQQHRTVASKASKIRKMEQNKKEQPKDMTVVYR